MTSSTPEDGFSDETRARALELRLAGASYDRIAQTLGYASKSGAYQAVHRALRDRLAPDGEEDAGALTELARLDAMLTGLWPKARRGEVTAIDRVLRIEERREQILAREPAPVEKPTDRERTGLSEFERRLRERESGPDVPHRTAR